jgi:hypothetical protein
LGDQQLLDHRIEAIYTPFLAIDEVLFPYLKWRCDCAMKSFLAILYVVEPSLHAVGTHTRSTFWRCGDFSSLIDKLAISFGLGAVSAAKRR